MPSHGTTQARTGSLRLVLGDQLSRSMSSLRDLAGSADVVLMVEVQEEATYVRHHKQKLVFIFSAMRHFAAELRAEGVNIDYVAIDEAANTGSFTGEVRRAVERHAPARLVVTEPGEWRVLEAMRGWSGELGIPVDIRTDDRFLCSREEFAAWARDRKGLRMEHFYRFMRKKSGWLMSPAGPEGGRWNYDVENRRRLPRGFPVPPTQRFEPDEMTREVMSIVATRFAGHFGALEPFGWAVTRAGALEALDHFVHEHLSAFGDFQDAMQSGEDFLFHAALSPYLNAGLLLPREVCEAALAAYRDGLAPLNAVEGFLRQILGWREYVRGIYWTRMPEYARTNHLEANRRLPAFYWTAHTDMRCMHEAVDATRRNAYAHHIQRLMVTGNFALLAGLSPAEVNEWYLVVYTDAYEWVELPNTHGMALHADGGVLGSKPYAASGAYIDRMSDYCGRCVYNPKVKLGPKACPFNYLYWYFLMKNEKRLGANPRMLMPYRSLARFSKERRAAIVDHAESFLGSLPTDY